LGNTDRLAEKLGTKLPRQPDAPSLETVYKLVEYGGRPTMKLSVGKQTSPGAKQVYRPLRARRQSIAAEPPLKHRVTERTIHPCR